MFKGNETVKKKKRFKTGKILCKECFCVVQYDSMKIRIPSRFMFCQNDACPKASACLRHLALKLLTPDEREIVVLNPLAYPAKGTACPLFGNSETVRAAWGIVNLLTTVPHAKAQKIKAELLSCFGRSKYYRMRREEIPVMPEDQALIKEIFMKNGIETDPEYSRFTEEYQWSFHTDETLCSGL